MAETQIGHSAICFIKRNRSPAPHGVCARSLRSKSALIYLFTSPSDQTGSHRPAIGVSFLAYPESRSSLTRSLVPRLPGVSFLAYLNKSGALVKDYHLRISELYYSW